MKSLLTALVRLFPRGFRRRFGVEMRAQVRADYDRARDRGRAQGLAFAAGTGLDLLRAACAERWRPTWKRTPPPSPDERDMRTRLAACLHDLRHALRTLRAAPGFAAVTVGTLGLALGANVGIFSVVDTVLLDPLPFAEQDRLVHIAASAPGSDFPDEFGVAAEFYVQYAEESELLQSVSTYNSFTNTLRTDDRIERVRMSAPTPSLFATLGATPILGRLPVPEDADRDVVVISHALWSGWFGSDPEIVGRTIHAGGADRTVIGVMGPEFWFPNDGTLLWIPNFIRARADGIEPGRFGWPLVARLAPGTEPRALVRELGDLARRLPERFGGSAAYARLIERHRPIVRSLEEELLGDVSGPLWVLLGSVGIVLLIACANVANLFLVRAERRQRALAVRRALGAGRGELVRALMAEPLVVAALAGGVAVAIAWAGTPLLVRAAPPVPRLDEVRLTPLVLLFTLVLSALAALACGLVPAIRSSASSLTRLRDAGGRGSTRARRWGRDGLVVAQTALALVLLIGSGLLIRSFLELRQVDPGYDTEDLYTFQIAPEGEHLTDAPSFARFHLDFMDRVAALPGVESVGLVENVPLNEGLASGRFFTEETVGEPDGGARLNYTWSAGPYFETMGIELLAGRPFRRSDHVSEPGHVVISRAAADLLFSGEDPVGKRLQREDLGTWETVIGVVEDVMQYGFRGGVQPLVYFPLVGQSPESRAISSPAYVVRTPRAEEIGADIRALVRQQAPTAPMYRTYTMAGLAADSMADLSFTMMILGTASTLALFLGAIGLFGILAYVVAARTREIGVRMALGAQARRVRRMIVAQGARLVAIGVALGLAVALATTRVLGNLLFGIEAIDAATFLGMSATMLLVGLLASYLPARRASAVDPIESLRTD